MMNCQEYAELLTAHLDGRSGADAPARLEQHEAECSACRALRERLAQLDDLLPCPDDTPEPPADFHAGWMKKVEETAMETRQPKPRQWTKILSVAAAAIFIVGGALTTSRDLDKSAPDAPRTEAVTLSAKRSSNADAGVSGNTLMMASYASEDSAPAPAAGETQEQKIIRNVSLSITTSAFDDSLGQLRDMCKTAGGWVSHSSEDVNGDRRTAWLSLRVPSEQLDAFLAGTDSAGRITSRSESSTDVTASYYDVKARLDTQLALMARLQALITDAADLSDLLALESQIADTQYQIDTLQAQLNNTDRQVDYATVDISLREEIPADAITDADQTLGQRFVNALTTGLSTFVEFLQSALVFIAAALPFAAVVAVLWLIVHLIRKRRAARK